MERSEFDSMLGADDRHWWYRGRRRVVTSQIERLDPPRGARLLDAGCGSGRMLDELARYGTAFGIDSSAWAVAAANGRGHKHLRLGSVERLPYPDASFDLVTCLDVLEHIPDDARALAELRRVTVPGGRLIVTVPAYQALWSAHDEANHHYRRYRLRTLRSTALDAQWDLERVSYFNSLFLLPAVVVRLARKHLFRRDGRSELSFTPIALDRVLAAPFRVEAAILRHGVRLPAGLSLLAVLRRPDEPLGQEIVRTGPVEVPERVALRAAAAVAVNQEVV